MKRFFNLPAVLGIAALSTGCATIEPPPPPPKPTLDQSGCFLYDPVTRATSELSGCQQRLKEQELHRQTCAAEVARFDSASKVLIALNEKTSRKDLPAQNALILAFALQMTGVQRQCSLNSVDLPKLFSRSIPPHVAERAASCATAILNGQFSFDAATNSATCFIPVAKPATGPAPKAP